MMTQLTNQLVKLLIIVSINFSFVLSSRHEVTIVRNGEILKNPCQTEVLSTYLSDINPSSKMEAKEGSDQVKDICPLLKYTCCNEYQLKKMANSLTQSFRFVNYRSDKLYGFFLLINEIQETNFKKFLINLKDSDIQCYNEKQMNDYNKLLKEFKGKPKSFFSRIHI